MTNEPDQPAPTSADDPAPAETPPSSVYTGVSGESGPSSATVDQPAGDRQAVPRTRTGTIWAASVAFAVVLVLLLIFVVQNLRQVHLVYFTAQGRLPLGVAMILAAIAGALLVAIPGAGRILQLRRTAKRRNRAHRDR